MKKKLTALLLICVLCLAGCQEKNPDPVVPTDVPSPTAEVNPTEPPTFTPEPSPTEVPAPTQEPVPTETLAPTPTQEPVPTEAPTSTPESTPTEMPTEVLTATPEPSPTETPETPFAMVSPVPQSEIVDIVGTMTKDTYPVVDGSTATLPLSQAVFMAATGEDADAAAQHIKHTKTTNSYYRLYDKEADLLIVYEPSEAVVERMQKEPILIKPIGLDALVFMANAANEVDSLTIEELVAIYSGQIESWSEVGGKEEKLLAFQRPVGSGSQSLMQKLVMKGVEMTTGDNVFRYNTMSDILEGMLSYNGEDNTLGYSVFYYANNMYFEKDLKFMGVNGVLPSTQTIYDGTYPCINAFYAAIRVDEPEDSNARKLFDWLTGEAGQQLVLDLGYVPVQMPEGADISDAKTEQVVKREVLATEPLKEGQYFVMVNPQNTTSDYYYGDMTVYNSDWEEIANFYNVTLSQGVAGIHAAGYLPVGQIRQNTAGEQEVRYGIYDLVNGEYTITPKYQNLYVLDAERCYYCVPQNDSTEWEAMPLYQVIGPQGEVLIEEINCDMESVTIFRRGNGYMEMFYDYEHWEDGGVFRFYDENLTLKKVFCEKAATIPDDADRVEGVEYYLMGEHGCLLDENGEILITEAGFLSRYGDGIHNECILPFYNPTMEEGKTVFGIWYLGEVYVVDRELKLLTKLCDLTENEVQGATFYPDMYCYWDEEMEETVYRRYDGAGVHLWDGRPADEVVTNWYNEDYLIYARDGRTLYIEEYRAGEERLSYTVLLRGEDTVVMVGYDGDGYVRISEDSGETIQNGYSMYYSELPLYYMTLYYRGVPVCEDLVAHEYTYEILDGVKIWALGTGEMEEVESESIFEEMEERYSYYNYAFIKGDRLLKKIDRARSLYYGTDALILVQGNYVYAVSSEGEILVRALQNVMGTD